MIDHPAEWDVVELGACLHRIEAGHSPDLPDRPAGAHEWGVLKVSAVRSSGFEAGENKAVTNSTFIERAVEVRDGDLLITRANTPQLVGQACYVENPPRRLLLCDKTLRLIVDERKLIGKFAAQVLATSAVRRQIEASGTGSSGSMKNISQAEIKALRFSLPTIPEQRQIVDILDSVDESIESNKNIIAKREIAAQGLAYDLLNDGIERELGELVVRIEGGWSPACHEVPPGLGQWGVLKVSAVTSGRYKPLESKTLPAYLEPRPELEVSAGDVIMCRANGVAELVGVAVQVSGTSARLMLSDKTLRIVPNRALLTNEFLSLVLRSFSVRQQVIQNASGSSGQRNISQAQIGQLRVPWVAVADQQRIVDAISVHMDAIEIARERLAKLNDIRKAMLDDLLLGHVHVVSAESIVA